MSPNWLVRVCREGTQHRAQTAKRMPLQATAVNLVDGIVAPMGSQINPPQEALAQQNSQWRKLRAAEK